MRTFFRIIGRALLALVVLIGLLAGFVWLQSHRVMTTKAIARAEALSMPTSEQLADGARQLVVLGCVDCHGEGLRGQLMFDVPNVASVYAPNLSLLAPNATDQQLAQAIRQGIGHDGRPLFVMPSAQYSRLDDASVAALIAAMRALPAIGAPTPALSFGPLGRAGIAMGTFPAQPAQVQLFAEKSAPDFGPEHAEGRMIAQSACSECHGAQFGGGEPKPGSLAPDLVVVKGYDVSTFAKLLREGVAVGNRPLGLMSEVSKKSFVAMTDAEIAAVHAYLTKRADSGVAGAATAAR